MSLTTRIRFTEPVDPREVWSKLLGLINPPADYEWSHVPIGGNLIASDNPLIYAESGQGADVWAYVMYGQDGCRLVEIEDDEADYPPAFVEASLISDWSSEQLHDEIAGALSGTGVWVHSDLDEGWRTAGINGIASSANDSGLGLIALEN